MDIKCLDQSNIPENHRFNSYMNNYCYFGTLEIWVVCIVIISEIATLVLLYFIYRKVTHQIVNFKIEHYGSGRWEYPTYCIISLYQIKIIAALIICYASRVILQIILIAMGNLYLDVRKLFYYGCREYSVSLSEFPVC